MTWCACRPIRSVIIRLFSKQIALPLRGRQICLFIGSLKVMLQETIRNTALQHCCDIVSNGQNMGPALLRCVGLVSRRCKSSRVTTTAMATKTSLN